ncbi:MAG: serine hydrolase [Nitriliruptoraceae bacterium]
MTALRSSRRAVCRHIVGWSAAALLLVAHAAWALPDLPQPALTEVPPGWTDRVEEPPESPSWLLIEASTGQVIAGQRYRQRRPVASTIKTLTALTALQRAGLDTVITAGDEVAQTAGAGVGLRPGDEWSLATLLDAMMVRSGNDAAEVVARHVGGSRDAFVDMMRADAQQLGIVGAVIDDPAGLDDTNRLSAHDLAIIGLAALADPQLRTTMARRSMLVPRQGELDNRNLLIGGYPGATGIKTGFTVAAGNSLIASARRGERELVAVVLGAGDDPQRFDDATRLLDYGFTHTRPTLATPRATLRIAGGVVDWRAVNDVIVTLPHGVDYITQTPMPRRWFTAAPTADLIIDGTHTLAIDVEVSVTHQHDPAHLSAGGVIGQAMADAAYAGLRAAADAGRLR